VNHPPAGTVNINEAVMTKQGSKLLRRLVNAETRYSAALGRVSVRSEKATSIRLKKGAGLKTSKSAA
jgi:hypothetical protein